MAKITPGGSIMKSYRKWFYMTLLLILLPLAGMAGFNYYIDPLWNFSHSNRYNTIQLSFDERQQKTNAVSFGSFDYDTLLLGSSRVTYIDQHDFTGLKTYNYSVSQMDLKDYYDFIEYAKARRGGEFKCIIIGLDFYATNRNLKNSAYPADYYISKSQEFAYRYKTLLSRDVFKFAWKNYQASRQEIPLDYAYDRNNVKTLNKISSTVKAQKIRANLDKYHQVVYAGYAYADVRGSMEKIKRANPRTRFIVFTTPEAWPLFRVMADNGLFPYYQRWLQDNVEVFGSIYNFDYPNAVTTNLDNYYDASHIYPQVGARLAHRLVGCSDPDVPGDFGVVVTRDNLNRHLDMVRERINTQSQKLSSQP